MDLGLCARPLGRSTPAGLTFLRLHAPSDAAPVETALAACRAALGDAAFAAVGGEVRGMPLADLDAGALGEASDAR